MLERFQTSAIDAEDAVDLSMSGFQADDPVGAQDCPG